MHAWGDRHYRFQTASMGKAFMWVLIGFATEDGILDPDEPIHRTWTGEGELSHPHKTLNRGHHRTLTWRHLIGPKDRSAHQGGFPMELGSAWAKGREGLPEWATWTGDPFYDLYSHVKPGTREHYSSAGFWRLGQALTFVWDRDLKEVLDERLFGRIGIHPRRWDWYTGRTVSESKYFYPDIPDSYTYLDPPYEINGHVVRSGPGWVVMSPSDIARFGHLLATRGKWKGEQLVDPDWLAGTQRREPLRREWRKHLLHGNGPRSPPEGFQPSPFYRDDEALLPDDLFVGPGLGFRFSVRILEMDDVRIGIAGLGHRALNWIRLLQEIPGVPDYGKSMTGSSRCRHARWATSAPATTWRCFPIMRTSSRSTGWTRWDCV